MNSGKIALYGIYITHKQLFGFHNKTLLPWLDMSFKGKALSNNQRDKKASKSSSLSTFSSSPSGPPPTGDGTSAKRTTRTSEITLKCSNRNKDKGSKSITDKKVNNERNNGNNNNSLRVTTSTTGTPNYRQILAVLSERYPVLQNVKVVVDNDTNAYFGYIVTDRVGEYVMTSNKSRYMEVVPKVIHVTRNDNDKIITFLHEAAHGITPIVERKVLNEWVEVIHGREFHDSFLEICNYCYERGILSKRLTKRELRMRDSVNMYQHGR